MKTYWGKAVPMRDGTRLAADLFLPNRVRAPLIVVRTPYGRQTDELITQARYFAEHGYAVLNVDVRGRGDSEGTFVPYRNEGKDGFDTIEWGAAQAWCSGSVGTVGGSYLAKVQWLAALESPPHLHAMIPLVSPSDPFVEWPTGAPVPSHLCWLTLTAGRVNQNIDAVDWDRVYRHLPLATMDEAAGRELSIWREECKHEGLDEWWRQVCYQTRFDEVRIPVLHVSGWYDDEQIGTLLNYRGMRQSGGAMRHAQRLLMGPWPHQVNQSRVLGGIDFGADAQIDLKDVQRRFFDRWLNGENNAVDDEDPVRIFVMGINTWRHETEWPPAGTVYTPWYLHEGGTLLPFVPGHGDAAASYRYDPKDPTPFITEPTSDQIGGPDDYRWVHRRDDVLLYQSHVLEEAVEVIGPVQAHLFVASSAPDTDFMVQLHDIWPDGTAQRLCDGMVRLRYRDGLEKAELLPPKTVVEVDVDCWNTAHVFMPGHRIAVHVASSAFPKYDRNLNTGESLVYGVRSQVAEQTVYQDAARPSAVTLPMQPKREIGRSG